ncbi:MAG: hypothetical protein AABY64_00085 [Bdellovibrionota bacterium]
MKNKSKNQVESKPILYHGRKPLNRREFLASGAIPFMAYVTVPSVLSILGRGGVAEAAEICASSTQKMAPVVTINLNGGAGLTRNWIPLTEGRELLQKYHRIGLGLGSNLASQISRAFRNNAPFYASSSMLAGLRTSTVAGMADQALMSADFVGVCQQSQNDTDANKFDIQGLIAKAGLKGRILPALGRVDNGIGVSNSTALIAPPPPLIVGSVDSLANALGIANRLGALTQVQKTNIFKATSALSELQARNLASMTGGTTLAGLVNQANSDNLQLVGNPAGLDLDPRNNAAFAQVWGLNANTARNDSAYVSAALVYNAINGNSGSIGIEMGGYDYHGDDLASTNNKDLAAGVMIGRVIQSFHAMQSKGFIIVNSDGGVGAPASDTPGADPTTDRGDAGAVFMIAYDPTMTTQTSDSQLGHMKNNPDAEAADDTFLVGGSVEVGAAAVFANYLSFNGMLGKFSAMAETARIFEGSNLDKVVKIHGRKA